jgi:hypothetical protein
VAVLVIKIVKTNPKIIKLSYLIIENSNPGVCTSLSVLNTGVMSNDKIEDNHGSALKINRPKIGKIEIGKARPRRQIRRI